MSHPKPAGEPSDPSKVDPTSTLSPAQVSEQMNLARLVKDSIFSTPLLRLNAKAPAQWLARAEDAMSVNALPETLWPRAILHIIDEFIHEDWTTYYGSHGLSDPMWANFRSFIMATYGGLKTSVEAALQFRNLTFDGDIQAFNNQYLAVIRRLGIDRKLEWVHIEYCFRLPDPIGADTLDKSPKDLKHAMTLASCHA
ncbi:hypothetical protein EC988_003931, partial [Linderina pennispora]